MAGDDMKTCIISFSSRENGNCAQTGKLIQSVIEDAELFDFSKMILHPCGNCAYQCFSSRDQCPYIDDMAFRLLDAVTHSDLTYFIIPNYCDYPCANYFIFNERSQCYFQGRPELLEKYENVRKRAVVVSNTSEENFTRALSYQSYERVEILFLSAKKYGKNSIKGDLLTDKRVVSKLKEFIGKPLS